MKLVFKDFSVLPTEISAIPIRYLDTIKRWLRSSECRRAVTLVGA
jgi:nucleosome binding factor SPN SPT16 subunit